MDENMALTPYETREILFYKTDNGDVKVEILLYQENLWLTQAKMAELFEVQKAAISKHLKNIFVSGELMEDSVVSVLETTAADGKNYPTRYYNLDAIIAVGYRVNSKKATMFRIWANRILCNRTLTCVQLVNRNLNRNIFALNRNPSPQCWLQVGQNRSDTADPE